MRLSSNGQRICCIRAVDGSPVTAFTVHEYEGTSRMSSRPRRFLFTGHSNGSIQIWDLTTAMEMFRAKNAVESASAASASATSASSSSSAASSAGSMSSLSSSQQRQCSSSTSGGPTPQELLRLLDQCDLTYSCSPTPNVSPSPSLLTGLAPLPSGLTSNSSLGRLKASSNLALFSCSNLSLDGGGGDVSGPPRGGGAEGGGGGAIAAAAAARGNEGQI